MSSYDGVGCIPILIIVLLACVFLIGESVGSKTQLLNDCEYVVTVLGYDDSIVEDERCYAVDDGGDLIWIDNLLNERGQ